MSLWSDAVMAQPNLRSRGSRGSGVPRHTTSLAPATYPRPFRQLGGVAERTTMSRSHTIARRTSLVLASAVAAVAASFGVASAQSGYGAPAGASPAAASPSAPSVAGPPAAATRPPV